MSDSDIEKFFKPLKEVALTPAELDELRIDLKRRIADQKEPAEAR